MPLFNPPKNYEIADDLLAGITVGIVTIPQAMAFSLLAGLPPIYGLYGAFIPLVVYAFFSTSNYLNVGPVSVIAIFIFEALSQRFTPFTEDYVEAVVVLGIMTGMLQVVAGIFSLGQYVQYLSKGVVSGFVQAAAVVIMISQLSPAFDIHFPSSIGYFEKIIFLFTHTEEIHVLTTLFFTLSLGGLFFFASFFPRFPMAVVVLVFTGLLSYFFSLEQYGIQLIGDIPKGLPQFISPTFTVASFQLLPSAMGIAYVATIGSYIMAKNIEDRQPKALQFDNDLVALGFSKIIAACFGSLVPAGSFNRSILSIKVGAKTQLSSIVASVVIFLTILFLTEIIYFLPQAVIAALIVYAVYYLFDISLVKQFWAKDRKEFFFFLLTFLITLIFGFVYGIMLGMISTLVAQYFQGRKG